MAVRPDIPNGPCSLNFCAHQKIAFYKWIMVELYIIPITYMYRYVEYNGPFYKNTNTVLTFFIQ